MDQRIAAMLVLVTTFGCSSAGSVTGNDRRAAIAGISVVLDSMNAAWRRADFVAANRPLLDEGLMTYNSDRVPAAAAKASAMKNPTSGLAGQYISDYTPRYDVLTRDLAVTTSENDFARMAEDSTRGPMQVALMTLVWKRTSDGWHILYYHESTRPKAQEASVESLAPYAGIYKTTDGSELRFTIFDGALNVSQGGASPVALEAFTDPNFSIGGFRLSFVRNRDGTVHGVLVLHPDGASEYFWRIAAGEGN